MLDALDTLVLELCRQFDDRPRTPPSRLLATVFREAGLKPRQQKKVKERFHAQLAYRALIDRALDVATPNGIAGPLLGSVRVLAGRVLVGELHPGDARRRIEWIDWDRIAGLRDELDDVADPVERLALAGSLPRFIAHRLHAQYGDEADALVRALVDRPPTAVVRVNTLRCTPDELATRLAEDGIETRPTELAEHGLTVLTPSRLFSTTAYREGWFEMQDEASQLIADVTAPPPGGRILDACAGAGGKTLALAARLANRGEILALDDDGRRLHDLRIRARRAGAHDIRAVTVPTASWPDDVSAFARTADRILIDAPCSGTGSLRRNPSQRVRLDERELNRLHAIQLDLVVRAATALRPGARLIYATCSVLRDENEAVVDALRAQAPELEPVRVVEILGGTRGRPVADAATGTWLQTLPHRHGTDGFFAAVLRRPRDRKPTD